MAAYLCPSSRHRPESRQPSAHSPRAIRSERTATIQPTETCLGAGHRRHDGAGGYTFQPRSSAPPSKPIVNLSSRPERSAEPGPRTATKVGPGSRKMRARDDNSVCYFRRHPGEGRDPSRLDTRNERTLGQIPAYAGMTFWSGRGSVFMSVIPAKSGIAWRPAPRSGVARRNHRIIISSPPRSADRPRPASSPSSR